MTRVEHDLLGSMELPDGVRYGIHTARALDHFSVAGRPVRTELVRAYATVKRACARANLEVGALDGATADAIVHACVEMEEGRCDSDVCVDALQGGAGTTTNMNVNEVLATRASELLGTHVDPLEHVNLHQSTNDTYPTALRIALLRALPALEQAVLELQNAYQEQERALAGVVTLGRTQLRDAVPLTMGRAMGACATALSRDRWRIFKCSERLRVVNLGGTAIGTGIAAPREFIFLVTDILREQTGFPVSRAENLIDATQNHDVFVEVSGMLRAHAVSLMKFARDLRLRASGPVGGLGELSLPALQAGSSIMPGKVNPVIPELAMQAAMAVLGRDQQITLAASNGELELNAFLPLVADALLDMTAMLTQADNAMSRHCVRGITADTERCADLVDRALETVTALIPLIGHERAVELARMMRDDGIGIRDAVRRSGWLREDDIERTLAPEALVALGWR